MSQSSPRITLPKIESLDCPDTSAWRDSWEKMRDWVLGSFGVPKHIIMNEKKPWTEEDPFLLSIAENKNDDFPRLVFADWLEEKGQEERAEFIRVQIELSKLGNPLLVYLQNMNIHQRNVRDTFDSMNDYALMKYPSYETDAEGLIDQETMSALADGFGLRYFATDAVGRLSAAPICYILPVSGDEQIGFFRGVFTNTSLELGGVVSPARFRVIPYLTNEDREKDLRNAEFLQRERSLFQSLKYGEEGFVENLGGLRSWRRGFLWLVNQWTMESWVHAGPLLLAKHPTIERVELREVEPYRLLGNHTRYLWFRGNSSPHSYVREPLFDKLNRGILNREPITRNEPIYREYSSPKEAWDNLSDACLSYAKEIAYGT